MNYVNINMIYPSPVRGQIFFRDKIALDWLPIHWLPSDSIFKVNRKAMIRN